MPQIYVVGFYTRYISENLVRDSIMLLFDGMNVYLKKTPLAMLFTKAISKGADYYICLVCK